MQTKSLHQIKMEDTKKNKPNMLTDSDYFLRDKEKEMLEGNPNTVDITGTTNSSVEEALQKKLVSLEIKMAQMTAEADTLSKVQKNMKNKKDNAPNEGDAEGNTEGNTEGGK